MKKARQLMATTNNIQEAIQNIQDITKLNIISSQYNIIEYHNKVKTVRIVIDINIEDCNEEKTEKRINKLRENIEYMYNNCVNEGLELNLFINRVNNDNENKELYRKLFDFKEELNSVYLELNMLKHDYKDIENQLNECQRDRDRYYNAYNKLNFEKIEKAMKEVENIDFTLRALNPK